MDWPPPAVLGQHGVEGAGRWTPGPGPERAVIVQLDRAETNKR